VRCEEKLFVQISLPVSTHLRLLPRLLKEYTILRCIDFGYLINRGGGGRDCRTLIRRKMTRFFLEPKLFVYERFTALKGPNIAPTKRGEDWLKD
jgi:hypothetical protein